MILKALVLENFRAYKDRTCIEFDDLTALVGKNDVGKSTILEALEIFFNNDVVKIAKDDVNVTSDSQEVRIGCIFDDLPETLVLDKTASTSLKNEYLLNSDGLLELHKIYNCKASRIPPPKPIAIAHHPSADKVKDLLSLKNAKLKSRLDERSVDKSKVNQNSNPSIRQAIWSSFSNDELQLATQEISLDKKEEKEIKKMFEKIEIHLPAFALFQADSPSKDADAEIQDPMKFAVQQAIKSVEAQLEEIRKTVEEKATDVANRTIDKLKEMEPDLAENLKPTFSSEPKWEGFKLSLVDEDNIPLNKRGSGFRRLVLLNFFRAEAERLAQEEQRRQIIYAIEEPELSQHPTNQEILIKAFSDIASQDGQQVILTTHVPRLAGLIPTENLRLVSRNDQGHPVIASKSDKILRQIAEELGVLPNITEMSRLKLLVCVEGPHDVNFLKHASSLLHSENSNIPNIECDPHIAAIALNGSNLNQWVMQKYFVNKNIKEFHIYDRDEKCKYQESCDKVNSPDNDSCVFTNKHNIESYFPADLINKIFDLQLAHDEYSTYDSDVAKLIISKLGDKPDDNEIKRFIMKSKREKKQRTLVKERLHNCALPQITLDHIKEVDPDGEIEGWLKKIASMVCDSLRTKKVEAEISLKTSR